VILTPDQTLRLATAQLPHTMAEHSTRGQWKPYPYLKMVSRMIARAVATGGGRLIFSLPPRTGKSELLTRHVPAWYLEKYPHLKVINSAHSVELARSHGRAVRNMFSDNPYFTVKLSDDSTSASRWNTEEGGGMFCAGVGTGIMGFGGHLILVDDPYPGWAEAHSLQYRNRVLNWFTNDLMSRREPGATVVILHQRMHVDDLTGVLMREQPEIWTHVSIPAIAEEGDPLGRAVGEAICPDRYTVDDLNAIRRTQIGGDSGWLAMYQQRPTRIGSGLAYKRFTDRHIDEAVAYNPNRPLQVSFDFNISPGMYCELGQYDEHTDQFTVVEEVYGERADMIECLDKLTPILLAHKWPEIQIFGDATGGTQHSTQTGRTNYEMIRNHLSRVGIHAAMFRVPQSNPYVIERVSIVNDALADLGGVHHTRIHPRCTRLIRDMTELKTDEHGHPDKSNKELSHAADAFGYRVCYQRPIGGPMIQQVGTVLFGREY